jgi:hypothetical protein
MTRRYVLCNFPVYLREKSVTVFAVLKIQVQEGKKHDVTQCTTFFGGFFFFFLENI